MSFSDELPPLTPIQFFQIGVECAYLPLGHSLTGKKYLLPDMSTLCHEESFGQVAMGWNEEGIQFLVKVDKPVEIVYYPDVIRGDSFEVFIDTRDVKTSGYNTRFCHHFFFLPELFEETQAGEITHFRTEDTHELCDPVLLKIKSQVKKAEYSLEIFIPKEALNGYDPQQFNRIGFAYRINRPRYQSQHFSCRTEDYQIEQQPSLWSSIKLIK